MKFTDYKKLASFETEAEKAVRKFFGTFANDIKKNFAELGQEIKIKRKKNHDVSQLTNSI